MANFYVIDQQDEVSEDTSCREITLSFLRNLEQLNGARIGIDFGDYDMPADFVSRIEKANKVMAKYGLTPITLDPNDFSYHSEYDRYDEEDDEYVEDEEEVCLTVLRLHDPVYLPVVHAFLGCIRNDDTEDWFMLELISRVIKKVADYDHGISVYGRHKYNGAHTFLQKTDPKVWVPDFVELRKPSMGLGNFNDSLLTILLAGGLYDYDKAKQQMFRDNPVRSIRHCYHTNGENIVNLDYLGYYASTVINESRTFSDYRNRVNYETPWGSYSVPFVDKNIVEYAKYYYHGEVQK